MNIFRQILIVFLLGTSLIQAQTNCEIDSIAPIIECIPSIVANLGSEDEFQIWAIEFMTNFSDNCINDRNDFIYSFTSDLRTPSTPISRVFHGCDVASSDYIINEDLLTEDSITIYVSDQNNNISSCKSKISVIAEHVAPNCNFNFDVQFNVVDVNKKITHERVPSIRVLLSRYYVEKDSTFFTSPVRLGQGYVYSPTYFSGTIIELPYEFISVFLEFEPLMSEFITLSDLILIQNHILGINIFTEEWQFIAADVNSDDQINIHDLLILRNVILGIENVNEINSHKIILNNPPPRMKEEFIDTSFPSQNKELEYTLIRIGDLNDQSN